MQQREIMDEQDVHLDELSRSITRQRDLSLQINDELDVHTGLLEGLDHDLDRTDTRLTHARRRLDRVARGAKENGASLVSGYGYSLLSPRLRHDWLLTARGARLDRYDRLVDISAPHTDHRVQDMTPTRIPCPCLHVCLYI